jgi:3-hydroxy-9,10-secoandrosta-1,3,5(10)-triene-9,17-dione monooxygenase reductase component
VDPARFRHILGRFATGVTVLTTADGGEPHGCTVNAFSSLSLDPPLVLACLRRESALLRTAEASEAFAVNILGEHQLSVARFFATRARERGAGGFAGLAWRAGATGSPVLDGVAAYLDCAVHALHDGGDHMICVGRVREMGSGDARPLVFADGSFGSFGSWASAPESWPWI